MFNNRFRGLLLSWIPFGRRGGDQQEIDYYNLYADHDDEDQHHLCEEIEEEEEEGEEEGNNTSGGAGGDADVRRRRGGEEQHDEEEQQQEQQSPMHRRGFWEELFPTTTSTTTTTTTTSSFFQRGREYESIFVNHRYTKKELKVLASYESLDYLPPDSVVYRRWLSSMSESTGRLRLLHRLTTKWDLDRFFVMGLVGFFVGLLGFLLHQLIDVIAQTKWAHAKYLINDAGSGGGALISWVWLFGYVCYSRVIT